MNSLENLQRNLILQTLQYLFRVFLESSEGLNAVSHASPLPRKLVLKGKQFLSEGEKKNLIKALNCKKEKWDISIF